MARKSSGEDPVARFQEEARWSSFTNSWSRRVAPGAPRWVRRMIIAAFALMAVIGGVVGLAGLLTHDRAEERFTGCPTGAVVCLTFSASPIVP